MFETIRVQVGYRQNHFCKFLQLFPAKCLFLMFLLHIFAAANGGMAERFNAPVLKTDVLKGTGGSNPSSSAKPLIWESPAIYGWAFAF